MDYGLCGKFLSKSNEGCLKVIEMKIIDTKFPHYTHPSFNSAIMW